MTTTKATAKSAATKKQAKRSATSAKAKAPAPSARTSFPDARMLSGVAVLLSAAALIAATMTGGGSNRADMEAAVKSYIEQNPGYVLDVLTNHNQQLAEDARMQAVNLVKSNDGRTVLGNPDGDVTIYEFADYNCGYCKRAFVDLMNLVQEDGNIRVVIKEFPILSEGSMVAARFALAAAELGKFEEMHLALMNWPGRIDASAVDQVLAQTGIDAAALQAIIDKGEVDQIIAENRQLANAINATGTPAFVIGDQIIPGAIQKEQMQQLVKEARASRG